MKNDRKSYKMIQKMSDFSKKMAFTTTAITLLLPLLPPRKMLYHNVLCALVAVVAVKFT